MAKRNKSALKAHRQNLKRRVANRALRSKLRTGLKAVRATVEGSDQDATKTAVGQTQRLLDKMATKGIIHRNTAARLKSRLSARVAKQA